MPGAPQLSSPSLAVRSRGAVPAALRRQTLPVLLLVVLSLVSFAARAAWIGAPCRAPCRTNAAHLLIFDETYYVNAARVIAGIHPPRGTPYADAPLGVDPNAEHPPLAKLIIAGSIELFGDGPVAWRLGSLLMGTLAILGMFALARAAGARRWTAFAAAGLMAADNLMIVHGRIGTLDIYALAAMVWAAAAYLRGRTLLSGVLIGIGICMKVVAAYLLVVLLLYEALVWLRRRDGAADRAWRAGSTTLVAVGVFVGLLAGLGQIATPYADAAHKLVGGGVFGEIAHIVSYGAGQTSRHGPMGIASYPWGWLVDYKPIVYLNINPAQPAPGLYDVHPQVHFLGLISPPILLLALPAVAVAALRTFRLPVGRDFTLTAVSVAWFGGTFLPFLLLSLLLARTSYIYYMVIVLPGMYLAAAWLLPGLWSRRRLMAAWIAAVVLAAVIAYPLTPLP